MSNNGLPASYDSWRLDNGETPYRPYDEVTVTLSFHLVDGDDGCEYDDSVSRVMLHTDYCTLETLTPEQIMADFAEEIYEVYQENAGDVLTYSGLDME